MSFQSPLILLTLLAIPLGLAAQWAWRRSHPPRSVPFPDVDLLAAAAPRPRRRRHVPLALLLLALAGFGVALARPTVPAEVPEKRATIMLVIDVSGSMAADDVAPYRLRAVQNAAERFLEHVPATHLVGLVSFSSQPTLLVPPTTDRGALRRGIESLIPQGATAIGDAINTSLDALRRTQPGATRLAAARILLLSDGANTTGADPLSAAAAARRAGVPIFTVALGTDSGTINNGQPVPPDPATLAAVARATGGSTYRIEDADTLSSVYSHLGAVIGSRRVESEVTAWPAGIGAALLALSMLAAWRLGGRLT